jgi:hypothetical protein
MEPIYHESNPNQSKPIQSNPQSNPMNFSNDVKFIGSAFEFPNDALTLLFQWALLIMIIGGIGIEERRN